MLNFLDTFLDRITMYRVVLYVLIGEVIIAALLGFTGFLHYSAIGILLSAGVLTVVAWIANKIFTYIFRVSSNVESTYITALILALIVSPAVSLKDFIFLAGVALIAISSKYILAINKKHIFNPAAVAVVITGFVFQKYASWWVGTPVMLPFITLGGFLIIRKLQKITLIAWFLFAITIVTVCLATFFDKTPPMQSISSLFLDSAIVFFATVMLTEPLTSPPTKKLQIFYGGIVVLLIDPHVHVGPIVATPELVLCIANIFSYFVSPKYKAILTLIKKIESKDGIAQFIFSSPQELHFIPGQYMEWTLSHSHTDSRGNRRYFTIASSPTEPNPQLGIRFYPHPSSYKKALNTLPLGATVAAGNVSGEFTLPKDEKRKLAFIAGGIGITPFRSMIKFITDINQHRDIILFYVNRMQSEICYSDIFDEAKRVGVTTVHVINDKKIITEELVRKEIPDFTDRLFYLSGSHAAVVGFEQVLKNMYVHTSRIKKDFFPGLV